MNMVSKLAAGVALSALMATGAMASDIFAGDKSLKDDANYASGSTVNWTGFYIGVQGGYGNANHELTTEQYNWKEETFETSGVINGFNSSGFIGGGRVGFDVARGRFLVGVFGDYNFSNMETTFSHSDYPFSSGTGDQSISLQKQNEWTIGGRAGYLVAPRTLAYILAGYTQTEYEMNGLSQDNLDHGFKAKNTFDGVSVGGGIEFAIGSNVFAGLEYTHTFYGDETWLENECERFTDSLDEDKIMATLKIKLNTGFGN